MKRLLSLIFICALTITTAAQWANPPAGGVPAYHAASPPKTKKLPPILSGDQLTGGHFKYPFQAHSYRLASKIDKVLYQLPCYCYCDRSVGHKSLRSCFESDHSAHCSTCMQEAFYAYKQTKAKKTVKQIRDGIIRGEHQLIDLRFASSIE